MYLSEAEKEDKEMTEAWKGEADSILVFVSSNALSYFYRQLRHLLRRLVYFLLPSRPSSSKVTRLYLLTQEIRP